MHYIIDGYNLAFKIENIYKTINQGQTQKAISQLVHFVRSVLNKKNSKIIIVFDGQTTNPFDKQEYPGVEVIFSKKPQTADDIIRNFIRNTANKNKWTVISSDTEIIYTAKDHGAKSITADNFLKMKSTTPKKDTLKSIELKRNPDNIDMDYWRKIFNSGKK
jgi:predicted RNA-binding protein with PIN domain